MIRNTRAKAMLIEVCFCDNQADVDLYERIGGADTVAQAISGGFLERLSACRSWPGMRMPSKDKPCAFCAQKELRGELCFFTHHQKRRSPHFCCVDFIS